MSGWPHPTQRQHLRSLHMHFRKKTAPLTDSRVKTVHEIILFMKVIKMYGWELMFRDIVTKVNFPCTNTHYIIN